MFDPRRLLALSTGPWPAALCTVISTSGSTPRKAGASMVVVADGSDFGAIEGTIGGGAVEHEVRRAALLVIATLTPQTLDIPLTTQLGMCCGGTMRFFIEPLRQRPPLFLFGAGHVSQALCAVAARAGFDVTIIDPRDELRTPERFPDAAALVDDYARGDVDALAFADDVFVVVATHDHSEDQRIVEAVLPRPGRYLALVASERKARLTRERCRAKGLHDDAIARLVAPAGLDIGAETPEEIALSIVAQMVQVRRAAGASKGAVDVLAAAPARRA